MILYVDSQTLKKDVSFGCLDNGADIQSGTDKSMFTLPSSKRIPLFFFSIQRGIKRISGTSSFFDYIHNHEAVEPSVHVSRNQISRRALSAS